MDIHFSSTEKTEKTEKTRKILIIPTQTASICLKCNSPLIKYQGEWLCPNPLCHPDPVLTD